MYLHTVGTGARELAITATLEAPMWKESGHVVSMASIQWYMIALKQKYELYNKSLSESESVAGSVTALAAQAQK